MYNERTVKASTLLEYQKNGVLTLNTYGGTEIDRSRNVHQTIDEYRFLTNRGYPKYGSIFNFYENNKLKCQYFCDGGSWLYIINDTNYESL